MFSETQKQAKSCDWTTSIVLKQTTLDNTQFKPMPHTVQSYFSCQVFEILVVDDSTCFALGFTIWIKIGHNVLRHLSDKSSYD